MGDTRAAACKGPERRKELLHRGQARGQTAPPRSWPLQAAPDQAAAGTQWVACSKGPDPDRVTGLASRAAEPEARLEAGRGRARHAERVQKQGLAGRGARGGRGWRLGQAASELNAVRKVPGVSQVLT